MRRRRRPVVPQQLFDQISEALAALDVARADLAGVLADRAPLRERRHAHARVTHAFDDADALLRQATTLAKERSYRDWSVWRHRLSSLDHARQAHLFAESDDSGLRPIGNIRAIDTGMSGPDIGELQHGQSRPPGTPPRYGVDFEALLGITALTGSTTAEPHRDQPVEPLEHALVTDPPTTRPTPSPRAAA